MLIRTENPSEAAAVRAVTTAAFRDAEYSAPPFEPGGDPGEAILVSWLRDDPGWIPEFSLVAVDGGEIIGHVLGTRASVGSSPALGLGPISVAPDRQGQGIGSALMSALLDAAEARGEALVGLLGDPGFYARFDFVPASMTAVTSPDPEWGDYFQIRTLANYEGESGEFRYAEPFNRL